MYQRLMNKMFVQQIGRNVQVYIDDMLVKSRREEDHLEDLRETFDILRSYNMKLNLRKCTFRVTAGKIPKIHGVLEGHRGQPQQDPVHNGDCAPEKCEGSTKPQRQNSSAE